MPNIRPVSDLRNHFAEITKDAQLSGEPIFLTKNGVGSIVVMSMESYEQNRYDSMVYDKLREAELQAMAALEPNERRAMIIYVDKFMNALERRIDGIES